MSDYSHRSDIHRSDCITNILQIYKYILHRYNEDTIHHETKQ